MDSCGGTWWTVAVELVELGGQLWWNLVDSYGGTQWTVAVEFGGQLRWNLVAVIYLDRRGVDLRSDPLHLSNF